MSISKKQACPLIPNFDYFIKVGNYIAMDKNDRWCQYKEKPEKGRHGMWGNNRIYVHMSQEKETKPWPDWEDSLFLLGRKGLVKVEL